MAFLLLRSLKNHLEIELSPLGLKTHTTDNNLVLGPPLLYLGDRPARQPEEPQLYPFVELHAAGGLFSLDSSQALQCVTLRLACGVYEPRGGQEGLEGILTLVQWIVIAMAKNHDLDGAFQVEELNWSRSAGDQSPFYHAEINCRWRMPVVHRVMSPEREVSIYGSGF